MFRRRMGGAAKGAKTIAEEKTRGQIPVVIEFGGIRSNETQFAFQESCKYS
jgi:hypothetical protein